VSDRLDELRRQRALQRDHLDWIEREIAALEEAARRPQGAEPPLVTPVPPADESSAEAILSEYVQPAASIEKRTRLGCILYLCLLLALMALGVFAVYLHARAARGR
jgi:hypothetical protein